MKEYNGVLFPLSETGSEGLVWMIIEDGESGHEGLHTIEGGDHLTVWGEDGTVLFADIIHPDHEIGRTKSPRNPGHIQPSALGYWIHWTQRGWQPDEWARLFLPHHRIGSNGKRLRAKLIKKEK